MTYQEFTEKVKEIAGATSKYGNSELQHLGLRKIPRYYGEWSHVAGKESNYEQTKYVLRVSWSTGGITGGSCWDDGNRTHHNYTSDNPPAEFTLLDQILEHFNSNISFLQYKLLNQTLIEHDSYTEDEYYGNSTSYARKTIELEKLYEYMKEKQWLNV